MLFFPQLESGAMAQYPISRRRVRRTVINKMQDGSIWRYGDATAGHSMWELRLSSLTDAERSALESFFETCGGGLKSFTWLDPLANLLLHSGDLEAPVWQADPGIQISPGIAGPDGSLDAHSILNTGQADQKLTQHVEAPADYHYCLSMFARSGGGSELTCVMEPGSGGLERRYALTPAWQRVEISGRPGTESAGVGFGLRLEAGSEVEVHGLQVEAQPCPSMYQRTGAAGGVHKRSRFLDDALVCTADGPGRHSTVVRILSLEGGA